MSKPKIVDIKWGQIVVELPRGLTPHNPHIPQNSVFETTFFEKVEKYHKDCRIWPDNSDEWDWNKTGTRHVPGIQFSDFEDLLRRFPMTDVIIFSQGMHNQLHVAPQTLQRLSIEYPWIEVFQLNTMDAVNLYNELRDTRKIIGLFHSTC